MDSNQEFIILLQKYIANQLTKNEMHRFFDVLRSLNDEEIRQYLADQDFPTEMSDDPLLEAKLNGVWDMVKSQLVTQQENRSVRRWNPLQHKTIRWWYWASAAIVILGLFFYYKVADQPEVAKPVAQVIYKADDASHITLPDGKSVKIENNRKGVLYQDAELKIVRKENNEIVFVYQEAKDTDELQDKINSVQTSVGAMTSFLLSDGSKVFLNSKSVLRFPAKFKSNIREVELDGEGYFEIAKNATAPFHVKTDQQLVEVLGTHFNVRAYNDEKSQQTTLLEGRVKVMRLGTSESFILSPGDQAYITPSQIITNQVDTEEHLGWVKNRFVFNSTSLPVILKEIERWYDVKFDHQEGKLKDIHIFGNLSRDLSLQEVLHVLSENTNYKFKIQERRVIMTL